MRLPCAHFEEEMTTTRTTLTDGSQHRYRRLAVGIIGAVPQIVEQLRERRDRFGFSYICVHEQCMETFGPIVEALHDGGEERRHGHVRPSPQPVSFEYATKLSG